jgi:hypothetical protein
MDDIAVRPATIDDAAFAARTSPQRSRRRVLPEGGGLVCAEQAHIVLASTGEA